MKTLYFCALSSLLVVSGCNANKSSEQSSTTVVASSPSPSPTPIPTPSLAEIKKKKRLAKLKRDNERKLQKEREEQERIQEKEREIRSSSAYRLASLEHDAPLVLTDPSVDMFQSLLDDLTAKFVEGEDEVADMTVRSQKIMNDSGPYENLETIMKNVNRSLSQRTLSSNDENEQKYAEYVAYYVMKRQEGVSPDDIAVSIRSLTRTGFR